MAWSHHFDRDDCIKLFRTNDYHKTIRLFIIINLILVNESLVVHNQLFLYTVKTPPLICQFSWTLGTSPNPVRVVWGFDPTTLRLGQIEGVFGFQVHK